MSQPQQAINALEREFTLFSRHYLTNRQARAGQTLERSAYLLLNRLEAQELMSLKELAEAFRLDVSTINRQVAPLLRQGLLERVPDPDGGLARKLAPTQLGLQRLAADRERSRQSLAEVLRDWPEEDVDQLLRMLMSFNVSIEDLEGQRWPRPER